MVYGEVAKSGKQGAVRSRSGNGGFDKGLNNEVDGFWKNCQIEHMDLESLGQELVDWKKGLKSEVEWFLEGLPNPRNMVLESLTSEMYDLIKN